MRSFYFLILFFIVCASATADLKKAESYFRKGAYQNFKALSSQFDKNSAEAPLIAYWEAVLELNRDNLKPAQTYLKDNPSPYFSEQLRDQLLYYYVKKKNWNAFTNNASEGSQCAMVLRRHLLKQDIKAELQTLWQEDRLFSNPLCISLYRLGIRKKLLQKNDIWTKVRALAGARQLGSTRRFLAAFPGYISYNSIRKIVRRSLPYILKKHPLNTRTNRELLMIATMISVRKNPKTTINRWKEFSPYFSDAENDHVWTVLALWAARWHRDDSLTLYQKTSGLHANDDTRAWQVRSALRANDYPHVLKVIENMPAEEQNISAWRYWRAVALSKLQREEEASMRMKRLAEEEDDYYGLLARDAKNLPLVITQSSALTTTVVLKPDFALAIELYKVGFNRLAFRVWRHAINHSKTNDNDLIAATQQAQSLSWYLASIQSANHISQNAAHKMRFPTPFYETVSKYSNQFSLDISFVYGLIRQESRFHPNAVSPAKAHGLMQIIPSTAKAVARKNRYTKYRLSRLKRLDTNVIIGTTYLAELAKKFNAQPSKVASAYNAGPSRVNRWHRASSDLLIVIENIPLTETRLYVKHLLANRVHYLAQLGKTLPPMKTIIELPIQGAQVERLY